MREVELEVKRLICFYEERGWNWADAACFVLMKGLDRLEQYLHPWQKRIPE